MYFKVVSIFILGIVISCSKSSQDFADVGVLGHAATGLFNPNQLFTQNSAEGIEYVLSFEEASGIEVDIQLSKDGGIWLFHDELLDDRTNATGQICEKSNTELQAINYTTLNKEKLALLSAVDFSKANGAKKVFLDIKVGACDFDFDVFERIKTSFLALEEQYNGVIEFIFIVNNDELIAPFLAEGFTIFTDVASYQDALTILDSYNLAGFFIRHYQLSVSEIEQLKLLNKEVILFEIRSSLTVRKTLKMKPDYILVEDVKTAIVEKYE